MTENVALKARLPRLNALGIQARNDRKIRLAMTKRMIRPLMLQNLLISFILNLLHFFSPIYNQGERRNFK